MKLLSIKFVWLVLTSFILFSGTEVFAQKKKKDKTLDGVKFTIKVEEDSPKKIKPLEDELQFNDLKMKSELFDEKYSFKKAEFTYTIDSTDVESKIINFVCEMENDMKDKLMWGGKVEEENIDGTIIWMKKDKVKKSYKFSGSIKKKK